MNKDPNQIENNESFQFTKTHKRLLLGSVFLMATSAIGLFNANCCIYTTIYGEFRFCNIALYHYRYRCTN